VKMALHSLVRDPTSLGAGKKDERY